MLLVVDRKQIFITAVCFYRQKRQIRVQNFVEFLLQEAHWKYFWNGIVLQEESQSGERKLNRKQRR